MNSPQPLQKLIFKNILIQHFDRREEKYVRVNYLLSKCHFGFVFRLLVLVVVNMSVVFESFSQTITTSTVSNPLCAGTNVNVAYTISGVFTSGNTFTAQLSNASGSFVSPVNIGTLSSTASGTISALIPSGQTSGTSYRIRVISSTPNVVGTSNSSNLTINRPVLNAPAGIVSSYCAGQSFTITNNLANSCSFNTGNEFTAQLSDATGSFSSPITISSPILSNTSGLINVTLPSTLNSGTGYRIRVISTNPIVVGNQSLAFAVNRLGINPPTILYNSGTNSLTTFCQGQTFRVNYTITNSCVFSSDNVFTAQLSDALGSFSSPVTLGSITASGSGSISANIGSAPSGNKYRIRVVSANPEVVFSPDNGADLIVNSSSGNPDQYGDGVWIASVYSSFATLSASGTLSSDPSTVNTNKNNIFLGQYIENNLSFDTRNRWAANAGPTLADASQGVSNSYKGCPNPSLGEHYVVSFKRTNIPCGYYQIDIPGHDDDVRLFIDGTQVFEHLGCCDSHTNAWSGFIGPTTKVEYQLLNIGAFGFAQISIAIPSSGPLTVSPDVVQCSAPVTPVTLSVSAPVSLAYAWTPTIGLTPSNGIGSSVQAAPTATTVYTATGTDAVTGCTASKTVKVTVSNAIPVLTVSSTNPTICNQINNSILSVSGASTYTWSPTTGLSSSTGASVIAAPSSTTLYTVVGSNGCTSSSASISVSTQNRPTNPPLIGPDSFGNNTWNVFCFFNNTSFNNYYGYYTENELSFNTTTRWSPSGGPSVANASTGLPYTGCSFTAPAVFSNYSISFKRKNFTCGYYQIDIPSQDDGLTLLVNGVQVFQRNSSSNVLQTNVWTGFLGPTSTVEFRLINNASTGSLQVAFVASASAPQTLNPNTTICAGTGANLSATSMITGATYAWSAIDPSGTLTFVTDSNTSKALLQTTVSTPSSNYTIVNTLTDVDGTGCSRSTTMIVTVDPLSNTAVIPTTTTTDCPSSGTVLTASGANSYTWDPPTGLSAVSGFSVIATPAVTTTYTVTGSNNCNDKSASTTITVIPLENPSVFPVDRWNVFGYPSNGGTPFGYYTDNRINFDTRTRWSDVSAPSTANSIDGSKWVGCPMSSTNYMLTMKRSGFTCGVYQLNVGYHDDSFTLLINGSVVASHNGCCDAHTNVWTGVLNPNSTVEWRLIQGGGSAGLSVSFSLVTQPASTTVWLGGTSTDWFTPSNWCNGIPTATSNALILSAGTQNMPIINASGAVVRNITISPAIPERTGILTTPLIPAASLTLNSFNLDVNGNWINNGNFTAIGGPVSFVGNSSGNTISTNGINTFANLVINKPNGITISSGIHQVAGSMSLTNGKVTQNAQLQFLEGSSAGASGSSYVVGEVTKIGTNSFTFPIGSSTQYRPIAISTSNLPNTFSARYFGTNPNPSYPVSQRESTLDHVSEREYWILNRISGSSNVEVTLTWRSSSLIDNISTLRVAAWNGSLWTNQGSSNVVGNPSSGFIASNASSVYGPFTFASIDFSNPLPVQLTDFRCELNSNGFVDVKWNTASELNSDYFTIERSKDGILFQSIGKVKSFGTTKDPQSYHFVDNAPPLGYNYYRLKQVDLDGGVTYYEVCSTIVPESLFGLTLYPNPESEGTAYINLNGSNLNSIAVMNSLGNSVNISYQLQSGRVILNTSSLASGLYIVNVVCDQRTSRLKLIVKH